MIAFVTVYVLIAVYSGYRFFTEPDFEYVGKDGLIVMALFWPAFLIVDIAMHGIRRKK